MQSSSVEGVKSWRRCRPPSATSVKPVQGHAIFAQVLHCIPGMPNQAQSGLLHVSVRQASVTMGLLPPSPSSCLSPLFHTPHSCKISCDITGMTSHSVRCDVSHKPDADHLHPWKHHRSRLPRHPPPQPQPRTQPSAAVQDNGQYWPDTGQMKPQDWSNTGQIWSAIAKYEH